ncbi:SAM complex subunit SAM35 NDAI_0C01840 [Naumovozyma dairenensis CBS 421]|uniref:Uncharacterized protein n=1 Tax=Naumovozyma dairenensis (strain ATCC 10597 / BCRC 20456 / CBS 421 / NBRC 0211 / NRRL Y-12639) TaxID=1071378 RepID=G0W7T4_NAUDC|nr:hypothetical protein NDAI_0C01840 [Naumovozyma dairenensis CBS 421]CCD23845.1 hypothetical protein NDAI_0C01840 [Naumovozyma dairenensis CBS 421]
MSPLTVPSPIKLLFDTFPLVTYPPINNQDTQRQNDIDSRTYPFTTINVENNGMIDKSFSLAVYNVYKHPKKNAILCTDPICQYLQFALCLKNNLKLPSNNNLSLIDKNPPSISISENNVITLSYLATPQRILPILIENKHNNVNDIAQESKTILTSVEYMVSSNKAIKPKEKLLLNLVDTTIQDCWISQFLFNVPSEQFHETYHYREHDNIDNLSHLLQQQKLSIANRNQFNLRNLELMNHLNSIVRTNSHKLQIDQLLQLLFERFKISMTQFENILKDKKQHSSSSSASSFLLSADHADKGKANISYLDLKLASYILCILNLHDKNILKKFVKESCPELIIHSEKVLSIFC